MGEETNYSKYMAKSGAILFTAQVIVAIAGLLTRMYFSRALSVENYGLFYAVFALFTFIQNFRGLGLERALPKFLPEFRTNEEFDSLKSASALGFLVELIVVSVVAVVLVILSGFLSTRFFGTEAAQPLIILMAIWFVTRTVERVGSSIFKGLKDMTAFGVVKALRIVPVFFFAVIISLITDLSLTYIAVAYILGSIVNGIWTFYRLRTNPVFDKGKTKFDKKLGKKLIYFGLPLVSAGFAFTLQGKIDTLAITWFGTTGDVGLYQVARPVTRFIGFLGMITTPLLPMVSELWTEKNLEKLKDTFQMLLKVSLLGAVPLGLIFIAFPEEIIRILFGPDYVGGAVAMQILSVGMIIKILSGITGTGLIGIGESGTAAKITWAGAGFNVVGNILLVPIIGIEGAALSTSLSFLFYFLLRTYILQKHVRFTPPMEQMLKIFAGAVATLLLVYMLKTTLPLSLWPKLIAVTLSGSIFYILWVFRTGIVLDEDLDLVENAIPILPDRVKEILRDLTVG